MKHKFKNVCCNYWCDDYEKGDDCGGENRYHCPWWHTLKEIKRCTGYLPAYKFERVKHE